MEELSTDFILSGDDILNSEELFSEEETQETSPETEEKNKEKSNKTTEEKINPDELFNPESVGSEEDNQEKEEEGTKSNKDGTSPKNDFYSSIASALKDDGILPDLDDSEITNAETFADAIEQHIQSKLNERQQRIDAALNAQVEVDTIRQYESALQYLDSIKDEDISDESEKGESLRKKLIYQDFLNKGFSKDRALKEVKKSFDAGSDIEDAKDALLNNIDYFNSEYTNLVSESQKEMQKKQDEIKKQSEELKKSILDSKEVFSGITLDKVTRQRAYDNITKPVYKKDDGGYLTAIQKYELDNPVEFRKYLSVLFTMTDGFKNIDSLIKGKVDKKVKQSIRDLENKLSNTSRGLYGELKYVGDTDEDSYAGKGWQVDI